MITKKDLNKGDGYTFSDGTEIWYITALQGNRVYMSRDSNSTIDNSITYSTNLFVRMVNGQEPGKFTKVETTNQMKFKVGDKVRIVNNDGAARKEIAPIGTETEIVEVNGQAGSSLSRWNYAVQGNGVGWCAVLESNLELVSNNMTIEVGDIVTHRHLGKLELVVDRISVSRETAWLTGGSYTNSSCDYNNLTLVSKANKGEIVGYELLKDLPGIPAGTKGVSSGVVKFPYNFSSTTDIYQPAASHLQNTTWFKPIYKPKDVTVEISDKRSVLVEKDKATIKGVDSMSILEVKYLYDVLNPKNQLGKHTLTITQDSKVKVGCQTFTKQDIQTVYNAMIKLK